jgi:tetratricopeptide (TPR) repeat protein
VPLLVVGTARPELLERRPGWGGGKLNATTLALAPLSDEQTALLIAKLLERPVIAAESQQALLERAGGNPLYAEQFAELFLERGSTADLPLPETLQGIIAARLDGLPQTEKELLRDAAVVGKVFWASALRSELGDLAAILHSLERKGFVRRQKRSSVEGESELAFAHALVRDVAYGQIARADRAEKHRSTAVWIESLGRPEDHAEMLAHHYVAALELAQATGTPTDDLAEHARGALRTAGDRAFALNAFPAAAAYYADALALWPADDDERPQLLFLYARALHVAADDRSAKALEDARDALLAAGDREGAAEAEVFLNLVWWHRGRRDEASIHLSRAEQLAGDQASPAMARVLANVARTRTIAGEPEEGIRIATDALAMAEALDLDELQAHALGTIGMAKNEAGDPTGAKDLERALELAMAANSPHAGSIANNLAVASFLALDFPRATELFDEGRRIAERFGDGSGVRWLRAQQAAMAYILGRWDDSLRAADEFIAECEGGSSHYMETPIRRTRGSIRFARNDLEGALTDLRRGLALAHEAKDPQSLLPTLSECVFVFEALGYQDEARGLVQEAVELVRTYPHAAAWGITPSIVLSTSVAGFERELREALQVAPAGLWKDVALASVDRDFVRAAEIWTEGGSRTWEAHSRLRAAEELIDTGRRAEGEVELQKALAFYRSVRATFFIGRAEALLAVSA